MIIKSWRFTFNNFRRRFLLSIHSRADFSPAPSIDWRRPSWARRIRMQHSTHTHACFLYFYGLPIKLFFSAREREQVQWDAWRMMKYVSFTTPEQQKLSPVGGSSIKSQALVHKHQHTQQRRQWRAERSSSRGGELSLSAALLLCRVSDGQSWANAPPLCCLRLWLSLLDSALLHLPNFRIVDERKAAAPRWPVRSFAIESHKLLPTSFAPAFSTFGMIDETRPATFISRKAAVGRGIADYCYFAWPQRLRVCSFSFFVWEVFLWGVFGSWYLGYRLLLKASYSTS